MTARTAVVLGCSLALALLAAAQAAPRQPRQQPAPQAQPGDKRDRVVAAPGTPFHGKAYWQAAAQCGGTYFKLGTFYSDAAIKAKVIKPDPAAYASASRNADVASRTATAFFEAAEHFLIADRKIAREEAVLTYDPISSAAGERIKTVETGVTAAKPCPELYQACRTAHPQMCNDTQIMRTSVN